MKPIQPWDERAVLEAKGFGARRLRGSHGSDRVEHSARGPGPAGDDLAERHQRVHPGHGVLKPHACQDLFGT